MDKPLVSICSITYNHAPYIRQCLDGFLMQKTNFKYEIIIHDDASTDGTTEIIKEYAEKYPDLIMPVFQTENQYSKGLRGLFVKFVFPHAKGKYIALCEGDDFWIDPYKLQKQVEILEKDQNITLVCSHRRILNNKTSFSSGESKTIYNTTNILKGFTPGLQTVLFRKCCIEYQKLYKYNINSDILIAYLCSLKGVIYCLPDITAVYRYTGSGVFSSLNKEKRFKTSILHFWEFHKSFGFPNNNALVSFYNYCIREHTLSMIKLLNFIKLYRYIKYVLYYCNTIQMKLYFLYKWITTTIKDLFIVLFNHIFSKQ